MAVTAGCRGLLEHAETAARDFYLHLVPEFSASATDELHLFLHEGHPPNPPLTATARSRGQRDEAPACGSIERDHWSGHRPTGLVRR